MLVRNIVQLSYGVPGILCYALVFSAIISLRKSLSPSFILIFTIMTISNIATWLNTWIYLKLNNEPFFQFYYEWLSEKPFWINAQNFLVSHFNYVQNIDTLLLTFDRYAAIASITKDTQWWNRNYLHIVILVHTVILGGHLAVRLPMANTLAFNPSTGTYRFGREESDNFRNALDANVRLAFGIVIFFACSIFNILSLRILRQLKNTKSTSIQKSFFFISLCIFVTLSLNVFLSCLIALFNTLGKDYNSALFATYEITYYFSDLFSIGPAIYTVLMPGLVRQFLVRKIKHVFGMKTYDTNHGPQLSISSTVNMK